jgi:site-specific recombinase XerD
VREQIDSFLNYLAVERGLSSNTLDAYFNDLTGLIEFLEDSAAKGFIKAAHQKMLLVSDSSDELIGKITSFAPPLVDKLI